MKFSLKPQSKKIIYRVPVTYELYERMYLFQLNQKSYELLKFFWTRENFFLGDSVKKNIKKNKLETNSWFCELRVCFVFVQYGAQKRACDVIRIFVLRKKDKGEMGRRIWRVKIYSHFFFMAPFSFRAVSRKISSVKS